MTNLETPIVTVQLPSQQTMQLNRTTGAQSDHFIQSAPLQEVGSGRLTPIKRKVGLISLGCAKNLVDAEILLGDAARHGYELTHENDEADVVLVNTCGFIDPAKEESINAILEAHRRRLHGAKAGQKLVVGGCLSQRYSTNLSQQLPQVYCFLFLY